LEEVLTSLETSPVGLVRDGNGGAREDESGGETLVFSSGSAGTAALAAWVSLEEEEGGAGGVGKAGGGGGGHVLAVNDVVSHSRCLMLPHGSLYLSVYVDVLDGCRLVIKSCFFPSLRLLHLRSASPFFALPPLLSPLLSPLLPLHVSPPFHSLALLPLPPLLPPPPPPH